MFTIMNKKMTNIKKWNLKNQKDLNRYKKLIKSNNKMQNIQIRCILFNVVNFIILGDSKLYNFGQ